MRKTQYSSSSALTVAMMYIVNAFPSELATSQSKRKTQFSCLVHITTFIIHIPAFSSSFFAMIKHRLCKNQLDEILF